MKIELYNRIGKSAGSVLIKDDREKFCKLVEKRRAWARNKNSMKTSIEYNKINKAETILRFRLFLKKK